MRTQFSLNFYQTCRTTFRNICRYLKFLNDWIANFRRQFKQSSRQISESFHTIFGVWTCWQLTTGVSIPHWFALAWVTNASANRNCIFGNTVLLASAFLQRPCSYAVLFFAHKARMQFIYDFKKRERKRQLINAQVIADVYMEKPAS